MPALPRKNPAVAERHSPASPRRPGSQGPPESCTCLLHRCSHHGQPRPLSLTGTCLPQRKGSASSQESCSWSTLVFPLRLSLDPRCPFLSRPPPTSSLASWGKKQMGFPREATTCLLHLPSSPHPLPLRASECRCHGNCAGPTCCFLQATETALGQ